MQDQWVAADIQTRNGCLPVGGTTEACHSSSDAIGQAATWNAANVATDERPIGPVLRARSGLTAHEASAARREVASALASPTGA